MSLRALLFRICLYFTTYIITLQITLETGNLLQTLANNNDWITIIKL